MTAVLAHVHSFGLQSDCRSNIQFVDEGLVFYPCGSGSVLLSLETGEQQVVGGAAQGGITALGLSFNRRLLAVAERNPPDDEGVGTVYMYDVATLKRRKLLALPELGSDSIVAIAFSADGKMCLTQGAGPDWTLVLWNIEKAAKALCTVRTSAPMIGSAHAPPVRHADLCMTDPTLVCVSGDHILRFYRIAEGQLRPLNVNQKMELQDFMAHAWLPDERVALGTSTGDVLMLEGLEYHSTLMRPAGDTSERQAICCMAACGRGFVAGCVAGQLRIYERSDDPQELYRCQKSIRLEASPSGYPALTSIGVSPGEDTLAISTDTNQLYKVNLGSCDVQREDGGAGLFEHMGAPSHGPGPIQQTEGSIGGTRSARINAVDSCIWKPLVATVGADRTFRLWNYQTKTVEVLHRFDEEPLSVALHPSGLYAAVTFAERACLCAILMGSLRELRELSAKGCGAVRFCGGGHLFAIASGTRILVVNTNSCIVCAVLKGHQAKVVSLVWRQRGRLLLSGSADGQVLVWEVASARRIYEGLQLRVGIVAVAAPPNFSRQYCVGEDRKLREVDLLCASAPPSTAPGTAGGGVPSSPQPSVNALVLPPSAAGGAAGGGGQGASGSVSVAATGCKSQVDAGVTVSALEVVDCGAQRYLLVGMAEPGRPGGVRMYPLGPPPLFPVAGTSATSAASVASSALAGGLNMAGQDSAQPLWEISCLYRPVTCMRLHHAGGLLFVGGEDGCLAIFDVAEPGKGTELRMKGRDAAEYVEEVLVTRQDLEARDKQLLEVRGRVDELVLNNEYHLRLRDSSHREKIREITDKFALEIEEDRRRYRDLQTARASVEDEYESKLASLTTAHETEAAALEGQHRQRVAVEETRYKALLQERNEQARTWEEETQALLDRHTENVERITEEYDRKVEQELERQAAVGGEKDTLVSEFELLKGAIEQDAEAEGEALKADYTTRLAMEREATLRLKGENGIMKKKFAALNKQVEEQREDIKSLLERQRTLKDVIKSLEKDIQGHKKEIREREETILDKDRRMVELKRKGQELEKFKFVLDYKIKELRRQIEPREGEIADMRSQMEEMDRELHQYHRSNSALDLMIGELRLKMDGLERESAAQREKVAAGTARLQRFRRDLHMASQYLDDAARLKAALVQLYTVYGKGDGQTIGPNQSGGVLGGDQDLQREYNRQRDHLERNVEALKRNMEKDVKLFRSDRARLTRENVALTEELNDLRREAKHLELRTGAVTKAAAAGGAASAVEASLLFNEASVRRSPTAAKSRGSAGGRKIVTSSANGSARTAPSREASRVGARMQQAYAEQLRRELEMQAAQIEALEQQAMLLQESAAGALEAMPA